jgi:hypothetical protein
MVLLDLLVIVETKPGHDRIEPAVLAEDGAD